MAKTSKVLRDERRNDFINVLTNFLLEEDEEVLKIGSNAIAFPITLENGEEWFMRIVCSIPTGSKDEPFDAYSLAEDYSIHLEESERKKEEQKAKKERKKKQDEERRKKVSKKE